jgi:hypothetical protein
MMEEQIIGPSWFFALCQSSQNTFARGLINSSKGQASNKTSKGIDLLSKIEMETYVYYLNSWLCSSVPLG